MRKVFLILAGMLFVTMMVSGCSEDLPTNVPSQDIPAVFEKAGPMKVLVGFSGEIPREAIHKAGGNVDREYKHLPIVAASIPPGALKSLQDNPDVIYVEERQYRIFCAEVLPWGVDRIDAEYVHSTYDGSGVNIAVLDTGGDMDHPDITWAGGYSVVNEDPDYWEDKNGHGTHCAGIISADDNDIGVIGVAPNCNIWAVQISARSFIDPADIIAGIDWVIDTYYDADPNNDIQIISMSFRGPYSAAEETALLEAYNLGVLEVAATGNDYSYVMWPAALSTVIAVTASDINDNFATYSNSGPEVELIAPGSSVYSTYKRGRYRSLTGTSMACPHVAGAAALAWEANPGYSRDQIRSLLSSTAEDLGLVASQQGNGLVDAENAALGTTNGDN